MLPHNNTIYICIFLISFSFHRNCERTILQNCVLAAHFDTFCTQYHNNYITCHLLTCSFSIKITILLSRFLLKKPLACMDTFQTVAAIKGFADVSSMSVQACLVSSCLVPSRHDDNFVPSVKNIPNGTLKYDCNNFTLPTW